MYFDIFLQKCRHVRHRRVLGASEEKLSTLFTAVNGTWTQLTVVSNMTFSTSECVKCRGQNVTDKVSRSGLVTESWPASPTGVTNPIAALMSNLPAQTKLGMRSLRRSSFSIKKLTSGWKLTLEMSPANPAGGLLCSMTQVRRALCATPASCVCDESLLSHPGCLASVSCHRSVVQK